MIYVIIPIALTIAWIPLFVRFLRGWRSRKNPVSLAICALIATLIYSNVVIILITVGQVTGETVRPLTIGVHIFVVVNFYLSFHWSGRHFPDGRQDAHAIPATSVASPGKTRRRSYSVPPMNVPKPGDD